MHSVKSSASIILILRTKKNNNKKTLISYHLQPVTGDIQQCTDCIWNDLILFWDMQRVVDVKKFRATNTPRFVENFGEASMTV